jgi:hypothetical protein
MVAVREIFALKVLRSSLPTQVLSRRPLCSHGRLTDEEWARLQPLLPENGTAVGYGASIAQNIDTVM